MKKRKPIQRQKKKQVLQKKKNPRTTKTFQKPVEQEEDIFKKLQVISGQQREYPKPSQPTQQTQITAKTIQQTQAIKPLQSASPQPTIFRTPIKKEDSSPLYSFQPSNYQYTAPKKIEEQKETQEKEQPSISTPQSQTFISKMKEWIINAKSKGYTEGGIKNWLSEKGYSPENIQNILSLSNEVKLTPADIGIKSAIPSKTQEIIEPVVAKIKRNIVPSNSNIKESYQLILDKARVDIQIEQRDKGFFYNLFIPKIDLGTEALLDDIRKELISLTTIGVGEIIDQKSVIRIKNNFMEDASKLIKEKIPNIQKDTEDFLIGILMQDMVGLGKIEFLISDPSLEEIVIISSKEPVRVYHKRYGWLLTNIILKTEEEITNYANIIARRVGRQISVLSPLLDAHVVTGDRANAVLYPISTKGNTITIRKFARDPWTIVDLIDNKTVSKDVAAILWLAIEYEMNVLISGGTASGKTVFLNSCMPFIPPNHRIISMEDTRELMLPEFLYWCPLVTRTPNPEGKGEVSMLDLLVNSLRMRPDRIILGEIRRQKEAEVLFEAMHTGHSVYSTVHADTANETIRRLTNPPISIPPSMLNNVNLNVVMFRDRRRGFRRATQLAEFMPSREGVTANILYRWIPEKDEFTTHNKSMVFFDELSRNTGLSLDDINKNLKEKTALFTWLIKNKIRDLRSFGEIMNLYYTNKKLLFDSIRNNQIRKILTPVEEEVL